MFWYILAGAVLLICLHYWRNYNLAKTEDKDGFNNFYFEVELFLSQSPHYEDLVLPAQCFKEFLDASYLFCKAGYEADKSPRVIGALIAEAASRSTENVDSGIRFLEAGTAKIIRENQVAQG